MKRECENGPELSPPPQPDPLTQAAQHKCCNPLLSTSSANKAFTRHHVAHVPPSTWNYCTPLTQLAFHAVTPFWVCLSYTTLQCHRIKPRFVFVVLFTPDRIICCLEVSQGAPILVFACVCADEIHCTVFY